MRNFTLAYMYIIFYILTHFFGEKFLQLVKKIILSSVIVLFNLIVFRAFMFYIP